MDSNREEARLMSIKAALTNTTNTEGWGYIKQMADNVVKRAVQDALDEENRDLGEAKRFKAKALQKGFADLFNAIDVTKSLTSPQNDSDPFAEVEFQQSDIIV
jgi:hypothetical protein